MHNDMHFSQYPDAFGHGRAGGPGGDIKFTIVDGQVTGIQRVIGTDTVSLTLPAGATFAVGNGTVTETLTRGGATETLTYAADASDSSLYHLATEVTTFDTTATNARSYTFTLANGQVTAVSESFGTSSHDHTTDVSEIAGTRYAVSGNTITQTSVRGNGLDTRVFTSTDGVTYKLASETQTFVDAGSATTALNVEPFDRMSFTFDGTTVTAGSRVNPDGTTAALPTHGNTTVTYTQAAPGYVVATFVNGSHTTAEVFHDGNGDGVYTEVAHVSGTTVDIVGLQAQISSTIAGLL